MAGFFARRRDTIVTFGAIPRDVAMIEAGMPPVRCGMAIVARIIGLDMIGRLAIRPDVVMATFTAFRGTHEESTDMAAFAIHVTMTTCQRKPCSEMIKAPTRGCR